MACDTDLILKFLERNRINKKRQRTKSEIFRKQMKIKKGFIACAKCGKIPEKQGELHSHRIIPEKIDPNSIYSEETVDFLCSDCHRDFHSKFRELKDSNPRVHQTAYILWKYFNVL